MKKNGFAITGFIYTIFVIFLGLMITILALFNNRKNVLDNLKKSVLKDVNQTVGTSYEPYTKTNTINEFTARTKGYYKFILKSPKIGNSKGSTVTFSLYLAKGETIYILVGSSNYNGGSTEIRSSKNDTNSVIARASYDVSKNFVAKEYLDRIIMDTDIQNNNSTTNSVEVNYDSKVKKNENLNGVQYIKDCINGNSINNENNWSEISVMVEGVNKAINKNIIANFSASNITDGNKSTYATSSKDDEQCIILNLERPYNIDTISILHKENVTYYDNKVYVSNDNKNYKLIRNNEEKESSTGIVINAYDEEQVMQVGDVYVPVKKLLDGSKWIRIFHHNNLKGTVYWDSLSQITTSGGYESSYKQSVLYNLDAYKNKSNQYEFLLEYSDISGYNRWIQTSNPVNTIENVTGYKAINISWNTNSWYGLAKSNSGSTLLDGVKESGIYYPVGVSRSNVSGIKVNDSLITNESTNLWVRIN